MRTKTQQWKSDIKAECVDEANVNTATFVIAVTGNMLEMPVQVMKGSEDTPQK